MKVFNSSSARAFAIVAASLALCGTPAVVHGQDRKPQQRQGQARPRQQSQPRPQNRQPQARPQARPRPSGTVGHAVPRPAPGQRAVPRGPERSRAYVEPRTYGYARPRAAAPVVVYPRPYYFFRPRYLLGYGIYVGIPVPYPVIYGYPTYVYGEPGYPAPPVQGDYGGVSFDITPDDAEVSVDGTYVGIARDFSPNHQPLTLTPGRHHVELQAPGLAPLAFDVDVVAGEVTPYRGTLLPQ